MQQGDEKKRVKKYNKMKSSDKVNQIQQVLCPNGDRAAFFPLFLAVVILVLYLILYMFKCNTTIN